VGIVVQKFGGSSLADRERLEAVAEKVVETYRDGNELVVVVSAMGETTDELLDQARELTDEPSRRELDMLLSVGERIAMALLSIAIQRHGVEAVSLTGSQCGIITTHNHSNARIMDVRPFRVQDELEMGKVVIVAGYQGTSYRREVTTLGRGGSDTTAVALAAALNAESCEIYTDVEGIYSADPRVVLSADQLLELSHEEMVEMARSGARVLNEEAVEYARRSKIALYTRQTHGANSEGTVVRTGGFQERVERAESGQPAVAVSHHEAGVWARDEQGGADLLDALDDRKLAFCNWVPGERGETYVASEDGHRAETLVDELAASSPGIRASVAGLASLVGEEIGKEARWVADGTRQLEAIGVEPIGVGVEGARLSWVVESEAVEAATRRLHERFVEFND